MRGATKAIVKAIVASALFSVALLVLSPKQGFASDVVVYTDTLGGGWADWSWDSTVDFSNTTPSRGSQSIAVTLNQGWAGLSLRVTDPGLLGSPYEAVSFWVHGGLSGTRELRFFVDATDNYQPGTPVAHFDAPAGIWTPVTIPLSALGYPLTIKRLNIADRTGSAQPTFYVDDIRIISRTTPLPPLAATVTVQANGTVTPVSPYLRASNLPAWLNRTRFADPVFRARTAASGVTLLRLPGGSWSNSYGWLSCELDQNHPSRQPCGPSWEGWVARPRDFIAFLQATGTEGMWVVSPLGTSKEAAAAVAYFNGSPTDDRVIGVDLRGTDWYTVGRWAQLRVQAGFPDPVGIKYWEFGNELYGSKPSTGGSLCQSWGWEDTWTCDGYEYVLGKGSGSARHEGYLEFRDAMRAVDPTIQVGAVGFEWPGTPLDGQSNSQTFAGWGARVISAAGSDLDFYSIHPYSFYDTPALASILSNPQTHWSPIVAAINTAYDAYAGGRRAPIFVTEFNLFSLSDQDDHQLMTRAVNALFIADSIGQAALLELPFFAQWDLANGRNMTTSTEYGLMHEDNNYYRAPQYYVYPLWARFGSEMLPATSTLSTTQLSVYAGRVNSTTLSVLAINKTGHPLDLTVAISGLGMLNGGEAWEVEASHPFAQSVTYNGNSNPSDGLTEPPATFSASGSLVSRTLAPHSITLLRLTWTPLSAPQPFDKQSPADGATHQPTTLALEWQPAGGFVNHYRYCLSSSPNCTPITQTTSTSVTVGALLAGSTYHWRVRACADAGCTIYTDATGGQWSFSTAPDASNLDTADTRKTVTPTTVLVGERVTYTLVVSSSAEVSATVRVTDTPWASPHGVSLTVVGGTAGYSQVGGSVVWSGVVVPPRGSAVLTLTVQVSGASAGMLQHGTTTLHNTAAFGIGNSEVSRQSAGVTVRLPGYDDAEVVGGDPNTRKVVTPTSAPMGRAVTFTLTLANSAPYSVVVNVTDTLPLGLLYVGVVGATPTPAVNGQVLTWSGVAVPAGGMRQLVFRAQVMATGTLTNVFTVGDLNSTVQPAGGAASVVGMPPNPPGGFGKLAPANGASGVTLSPTLQWQGAGGLVHHYRYCLSTVSGCAPSVVVSNTSATVGNLQPGRVYFWRVRACADAGCTIYTDATGGQWSFSTAPDASNLDNADTRKTVTPTTVLVGERVTYTLVVSNSADVSATVRVTDTPWVSPHGVSLTVVGGTAGYSQVGGSVVWSGVVVPPRGSAVLTLTVQVSGASAGMLQHGTTTLHNTAAFGIGNGEVSRQSPSVAVRARLVYVPVARKR